VSSGWHRRGLRKLPRALCGPEEGTKVARYVVWPKKLVVGRRQHRADVLSVLRSARSSPERVRALLDRGALEARELFKTLLREVEARA
jgi:hypothetical protein